MIRIVFVEDDPVMMANLRRVLAVMRREWDMKFFDSGEEALVSMADRSFDVVVTDLHMQGMSGIELLATVQFQYPRAVRVLLSEASDAEGAVRSAGVAHRILRKPCDPSQLAAAIQRAFELEQRLSDPDLQSMISEVGTLPSPSRNIMDLNDLLGREDTSVAQVAEIVSSDVNMTAKLMQVVNSAYFGLNRHVTDIGESVAYLGFDTVRNLCVAVEMMKGFDTVPPLVSSVVDELHEHSLTVAHIARGLIKDRSKSSEAFVAGLLHDVGLFLIATTMPEQFLELRVQTMRTSLPLTEVETEVLGAHHADIGAHLLDLWGLPYEIIEAVARHHDASQLPVTGLDSVHAVFVADAIASGQAGPNECGWEHDEALDEDYLEALGVVDEVLNLTLNING